MKRNEGKYWVVGYVYVYCICLSIDKSQRSWNRHRSEKKWREVTWSDDLWRFACGDVYSYPSHIQIFKKVNKTLYVLKNFFKRREQLVERVFLLNLFNGPLKATRMNCKWYLSCCQNSFNCTEKVFFRSISPTAP